MPELAHYSSYWCVAFCRYRFLLSPSAKCIAVQTKKIINYWRALKHPRLGLLLFRIFQRWKCRWKSLSQASAIISVSTPSVYICHHIVACFDQIPRYDGTETHLYFTVCRTIQIVRLQYPTLATAHEPFTSYVSPHFLELVIWARFIVLSYRFSRLSWTCWPLLLSRYGRAMGLWKINGVQ